MGKKTTANDIRERAVKTKERKAQEEAKKAADLAAKIAKWVVIGVKWGRSEGYEECMAQIKRCADEGYTSTTFHMSQGDWDCACVYIKAATQAMVRKLRRHGFSASTKDPKGERMDMGDFNAPCLTTIYATEVEIRWEK